MNIAKNTVVQFHYNLCEADGTPVESSYDGGEPMAYLQGHHNIFPKLEAALEGKAAGDKLEVELAPADGYGERQAGSTQRVPIKHLLTKGRLRPGMSVKVNTEQGPRDATVVKVGLKNVDLDTNHPLAGKQLKFAIEVVSVREATADEISHGHAHGVGGHHH